MVGAVPATVHRPNHPVLTIHSRQRKGLAEMLLRKASAGSDSFGNMWPHDDAVLDIPDDQAAELLAIPDGGYAQVSTDEPRLPGENVTDTSALTPLPDHQEDSAAPAHIVIPPEQVELTLHPAPVVTPPDLQGQALNPVDATDIPEPVEELGDADRTTSEVDTATEKKGRRPTRGRPTRMTSPGR